MSAAKPLRPDSKLAKLGHAGQLELNRLIRDGAGDRRVLKWLAERGCPGVTEKNLSRYRETHYRPWAEAQDRADRLRDLSAACVEYCRGAGGNLAEGASAIMAGRLLEAVELLDREGPLSAEDARHLVAALGRLRDGDHRQRELSARERAVAAQERAVSLAERKYQDAMVEKVIEKARELADLAAAHKDASDPKLREQVRARLFGARPQEARG